VLIPGVLIETNFIEHPELIAQRIGRTQARRPRERHRGSDCGTAPGWAAAVDRRGVAKMAAMAEGARIATRNLGR